LPCRIKQWFPQLPIFLHSAYSDIPERILWQVEEYVMKSELSERLVPTSERAHGLAQLFNEPLQREKGSSINVRY
jgi:hypothetical protein